MNDSPASRVAKEIHARFNRKMAAGGRIDKILAGWERSKRPPALPDAVIERIKRSIEIQLTEYADAIGAASSWWQRWKPHGFRCKRLAPTARACAEPMAPLDPRDSGF